MEGEHLKNVKLNTPTTEYCPYCFAEFPIEKIFEHVAKHDTQEILQNKNSTSNSNKSDSILPEQDQDALLAKQLQEMDSRILADESSKLAKKLMRVEQLENNASLKLLSATPEDELKLRGFFDSNFQLTFNSDVS